MKKYFLISLILFYTCSSFAQTHLEQLQRQAISLQLHHHPAWLALGYYQPSTLGYLSQADDPDFFFAADGVKNPKAELLATLAAFFQPTTSDSNQHPQCRFPARYTWLQQSLNMNTRLLPQVHCAELQEWQQRLNAQHITAVFPASYLNSASSMFGHLFLRLDQPNQTADNRLLAYTVNYSANILPTEHEALTAFKGIIGGYQGMVAILPYYIKVKEYNDWENRDIWEYALNLTPAEVQQLVRHVWELQQTEFNYYFFDENCASRILDILQVARPTLKLNQDFQDYSIPADVMRAIVKNDLVEDTRYRPASATELRYHIKRLSKAEQDLVLKLARKQLVVNSAEIQAMPEHKQKTILELTINYLNYQLTTRRLERKQVAPLLHQLLLARSQLSAGSGLSLLPTPKIRPDEGHNTFRVKLGSGVYDHQGFTEVELRPAYHSLEDPLPGYQPGSQIEFLKTAVRYTEDDHTQLKHFTLIDIASLTPRSKFFDPLSWAVRVGTQEEAGWQDADTITFLEGGVGLSYQWQDYFFYSLLEPGILHHPDLDKGYSLGASIHMGLFWQTSWGQWLVKTKLTDNPEGAAYRKNKLELTYTYPLNRDYAISLQSDYEKRSGNDLADAAETWEYSLNLSRYF